MHTQFENTWTECYEVIRNMAGKSKELREALGSKQQKNTKLLNTNEFIAVNHQIYNLCIAHNSQNSDKLYRKYVQVLSEYLTSMSSYLSTAKDIILLKEIRAIWNCYRCFMRPCRNLFSYLDKYYVHKNNQPSLEKKALSIFCDIILNNTIFSQAQQIYRQEAKRIRQTSDISSCMILKDFVSMLLDIKKKSPSSCQEQFKMLEQGYLYSAEEFFRKKYKQWESISCGDYLQQVQQLFVNELQLFERCFNNPDSLKALQQKFSNELVTKYKDILVNKSTGLVWMLENQRIESLKILNDLYRKLSNFDLLKQKFQTHMQKELSVFLSNKYQEFNLNRKQSIEQQLQNQVKLIREIFIFYRLQHRMLQQSFPDNAEFMNSYRFAIERVLNKPGQHGNICDMLANYSDSILRDKKIDEGLFEQQLKHIFNIFECLTDKDIFIKAYTERLAERLLSGSCRNPDYENTFKSILKQNCGVLSVQAIENILSDFLQSDQQSKNFSVFLEKQHRREDLHVRMLCKGFWPCEESANFELPLFDELLKLDHIYRQYFKSQEQYRFKSFKWMHLYGKVTWGYQVDKTVINAGYKYEECSLIMNDLQAALLHFIYSKRMEYIVGQSVILSSFAVQPELLIGSLKILTKEPNNIVKFIKHSQTGEVFYEFNSTMAPKSRRVTYKSYIKDTQQLKQEEVENDRSVAIEMAIVKIMKDRKRIKFDRLIEEVAELLRNFQPSIKMIKESIQKLVEKEYLERDQKDFSEYRYIE